LFSYFHYPSKSLRKKYSPQISYGLVRYWTRSPVNAGEMPEPWSLILMDIKRKYPFHISQRTQCASMRKTNVERCIGKQLLLVQESWSEYTVWQKCIGFNVKTEVYTIRTAGLKNLQVKYGSIKSKMAFTVYLLTVISTNIRNIS